MTQEEKNLLLEDLCARLPYGVRCVFLGEIPEWFVSKYNGDESVKINFILSYDNFYSVVNKISIIKPYLRPMSSMTEEEFFEYNNIKYSKVTYRNNYKRINVGKFHNVGIIPIEDYLDWLNAHHFDYRGLIEKGLALEATENMYNIINI